MKTLSLRFVLWTGLLIVASLTPWSSILGTSAHVIGAWAIIVPLLGALLPLSLSSSVLAALALGRWYTIGLPLALGLPTALATISWGLSTAEYKTKTILVLDALLHVALPLTCIILFITNPTGHQAAVYTSYWLIPMALWVLRIANYAPANSWLAISGNALQSTFIAHAVGSIIWLYAVPMSASHWLALIPVVAVERLLIAGMSILALQAMVTAANTTTKAVPTQQ